MELANLGILVDEYEAQKNSRTFDLHTPCQIQSKPIYFSWTFHIHPTSS
jgi:hypothetical protein